MKEPTVRLNAEPAIDPLRVAPVEAVVYVVDRDPSVRRALVDLCTSAGLYCEVFATVPDLLGSNARTSPGCLIVDLQLSDFNPLSLSKSLSGALAALPVIFMAGYAEARTIVCAMKSGAVDFLTKPLLERDVLAAIGQAVSRSHAALQRQIRLDSLRARLNRLTRREWDVFRLLVAGRMNKHIAAALAIKEHTVKVHRHRIMQKLEADSLAALVHLADKMAELPGAERETGETQPGVERQGEPWCWGADAMSVSPGQRSRHPSEPESRTHMIPRALQAHAGRTVVAVIEPDAQLRLTVGRLLRSVGFDVVDFASAEEFLEGAAGDLADVAIVDVVLPGMSGAALCKALADGGRPLPTVLIEGHVTTNGEELGPEASAHRSPKPFRDQELFRALDHVRKLAALGTPRTLLLPAHELQ
jgi:FixJ family two-component response regulator